MGQFLLGVLSSMVAAFVIYLLRYQVSGIINFLFSKVYPNISGQWTVNLFIEHDNLNENQESQLISTYDDDENIFVKAKIKQFANRLSGTIETIQNGTVISVDEIKGKVTASRIALMTYQTKTEGHHDFGSLLLQMSSDTKELTGYVIFLCVTCQNTGYNYVEMEKD